MPAFFDTNVLLYAISPDTEKAMRARELLRQGGFISVQVLNEATRVLRGKLRYDWPDVHGALAEMQSVLEVVPLTVEIHHLGLDIAERYKLGIFDSMIVAAARASGCDALYSEDMQDGLLVQGWLTITNPFRT